MEKTQELSLCQSVFSKIPRVKFTSKGTFKYILIDLEYPTSGERCCLVRGDEKYHYHADNFAAFNREFDSADITHNGIKLNSKLNVKISCPGGGRVSHDEQAKSLSIYGYSQSYGQGDHDLTAKIVKEELGYTDIKVSYEGY